MSNYRTMRSIRQDDPVLAYWAASRETHVAVAAGIFAIATSERTPEKIWQEPTAAEWDHVTMAVEQYIRDGEAPASDDGRYQWGEEAITLQENDYSEGRW